MEDLNKIGDRVLACWIYNDILNIYTYSYDWYKEKNIN